jgi:hypothetical protein
MGNSQIQKLTNIKVDRPPFLFSSLNVADPHSGPLSLPKPKLLSSDLYTQSKVEVLVCYSSPFTKLSSISTTSLSPSESDTITIPFQQAEKATGRTQPKHISQIFAEAAIDTHAQPWKAVLSTIIDDEEIVSDDEASPDNKACEEIIKTGSHLDILTTFFNI